MEPELYKMALADVSIHMARMMLKKFTPKCLEAMAHGAVRAAKILKKAEVDMLIYECTFRLLIKGIK